MAEVEKRDCATCALTYTRPMLAGRGVECRGAPPTAVLAQSPGGGVQIIAVWPPASPGNWCGAWQPKPPVIAVQGGENAVIAPSKIHGGPDVKG